MNMTYNEVFHGYVAKKYAPLKNAAKLLARDAGVSKRTAESWIYQKSAAQGEHLIRLMASCDDLVAEIYKLVEAKRGNAPD